jgi:hypothetical protein
MGQTGDWLLRLGRVWDGDGLSVPVECVVGVGFPGTGHNLAGAT